MAEVFFNETGQRVFDVFAENQSVLKDLDLVADIGAPFTAKIYTFAIEAQGTLTIDFDASVDNAKVSGIEVVYYPNLAPTAPFAPPVRAPTAAPTKAPVTSTTAPVTSTTAPVTTAPVTAAPVTSPTTPPSFSMAPTGLPEIVYRVNAGSFAFTSGAGNVWVQDTFSNDGTNFTDNTAAISE